MSVRLKGRSLFYIVLIASLFSALFISILLGLVIVIGAVIYHVWKGKQTKRTPAIAQPESTAPPSDDTVTTPEDSTAADDGFPADKR